MRGSRLIGVLILSLAMVGGACKKSNNSSGGAPGVRTVEGPEIVVGEVGSMTGNEATFGISTHQGIELAVKQINASGGVKGKMVKLVSLDDQGKPDEAALATTKLITQDRVIAVLGEVASSRSLYMAPIAQDAKIPMVTPSSTNPKVTQIGDYIFRVCFIDPFQGQVMAKFARENLKVTKVAILRDVKNDYSIGLADFFADTFKKMGGEIIVDQSYSNGDIDFKAQLTAMRGKAPEAIFIPGYYGDVGLIARQARELGITVPLMGGDGWDSPKLNEIGGKAMNNSYFSNHYTSEDQSPHVQSFIKDFKAAYNVVPDGLAAMGYDAMRVLEDAMKRAPALNALAIRDALAATKDYQAVTGKITINSERNAVKSAVVLKVQDGEFKYQTTINP